MASKRRAERVLTDRDDPDADELGQDTGEPWKEASKEEIAQRRMVKARRAGALQPENAPAEPPSSSAPSTAPSATSWPQFSFSDSATPSVPSESVAQSNEATKPDAVSEHVTPEKPALTSSGQSWPSFSFTPVPVGSDAASTASPSASLSASTWPSFSFSSPKEQKSQGGETTAPSAAPSWPSFENPLKPATFKFTPSEKPLSALPTFNFDVRLLDNLASKEKDDEEGVAGQEKAGETSKEAGKGGVTGVWSASSGIFGKDIQAPSEGQASQETLEKLGLPANLPTPETPAPPATLAKLDKVETGEESERTDASIRAKLFAFDATVPAWRERGVGVFKVNTNEDGKVRLLMRMESTHRVMLNAALIPAAKPTATGPKQFSCINVAEEGAERRLNNFRLMAKPEDRDALLKVLEAKCGELVNGDKNDESEKKADGGQKEGEEGVKKE